MARAEITLRRVWDRNTPSADIAYSALTTALDGADGGEITWNVKDEHAILLIQNSATSAGTATIKAGNGLQGVCDLEIPIAASSCVFLSIDSGRFKNVSGDDKGKVILSGASTIKVAAFSAP